MPRRWQSISRTTDRRSGETPTRSAVEWIADADLTRASFYWDSVPHCRNPPSACQVRGRAIPCSDWPGNHFRIWRAKRRRGRPRAPVGMNSEIEFARDSPVEEAGFELSVPPERKAFPRALDRFRRPSLRAPWEWDVKRRLGGVEFPVALFRCGRRACARK